jgi:hypothetical protein
MAGVVADEIHFTPLHETWAKRKDVNQKMRQMAKKLEL